jgi:hypothetical protein
MSTRHLFPLLVIVFALSGSILSCRLPQHPPEVKTGSTKSDTLWLDFAKALESKDIRYLKEHSMDSIQCAECNCRDKTDIEYYKSEEVFSNCIEQLMHLKSLTNVNFSTSEYGDEEIRVNYTIKSPMAEEGAYNLIFLFTKRDSGYLFKGMIVT